MQKSNLVKTWRVLAAATCILVSCGLWANAGWGATQGEVVQGKWTRVNLKAGDLILQDIRFELPNTIEVKNFKTKGRNRAQVSIQNMGEKWVRASIGLAIYDKDGKLVGVASGGSRFGALREGKTSTFTLYFNYVQERLKEAVSYDLVVEVDDHK